MASTTTEAAHASEAPKARRRTGGPMDPTPYTVVSTLSAALLAVVLAIQATNTTGRMLAWAAIVGHLVLGATMMLSARHDAQGGGILRHAWTGFLVVTMTCEFLAMMVVWSGLHL